MGTNVIFSSISFITQAVSGVLQLAVSLDYAVFLLHEFKAQKELTEDKNLALEKAVEISSSSLISSALTTIFGFSVLAFMRFGIGIDLGLVLAKGVIFSLMSVIFFLPALTKLLEKVIEKTEHRDFLPDFTGLSKSVIRLRRVILPVLLLIPIVFVAQKKNDFTYGMGAYQENSVEYKDQAFIEENFGKNVQVVLLVPKGNLAKESKLIADLKENNLVRSVNSFTEQVGKEIPTEIPPAMARKALIGEKYSRIILNTSSKTEGKEAFEFVNEVKEKTSKYYKDFHLLGESVVMEELARIIEKDNNLVNLLAILTVALVIMFNFKSISIPLLLVLTIETSIWINLSIPYFTGTKLSFIGYLIISSIQLGATVDYAILYTDNYMYNRKKMDKKEALIKAGAKVYGSIIPPALILMTAGIVLSIISSISLVSELGTVLARGALLSLILVMFLLPVLLYLSDGLVEKTSLATNFRKEKLWN